ncbi:MAG: GNAT family N-acetyltransferase [Clostridia bacterium]
MNSRIRFKMNKLGGGDIPALIALSASIGWDYDEQEINTIMTVGTVYGHKTEQGELISSAAIIPYRDNLASIGMVIVNKAYRGYGLGRELTQTCVQSVSNEVTIMLIATKEGKPLYESLGFQEVSCVHKFLRENDTSLYFGDEQHEFDILPIADIHFTQVHALDQSAVGADREVFLQNRIRQAKQGIVVKEKTGKTVGYGLSVETPYNVILGPVVAINQNVAAAIINHFAKGYRGRLRIDVPDEQRFFLPYLEKCGFQKVSQPPIMIKNAGQLPQRNRTLYGIAAQIYG